MVPEENAFLSLVIVLKPGPAWQVDPGLKPGQVEKKQGREKPGVTRLTGQVDPATRQYPVKNLVATHWLLLFFY